VPVFTADGKYVVQIAAASTEAAANSEWNKRVKASPELFSSAAEKIIVQADVNGRTVYRVRVGAFATAANADAFCSAIKAKGGACFRTAR
jgi:cell division septation protein DedD